MITVHMIDYKKDKWEFIHSGHWTLHRPRTFGQWTVKPRTNPYSTISEYDCLVFCHIYLKSIAMT